MGEGRDWRERDKGESERVGRYLLIDGFRQSPLNSTMGCSCCTSLYAVTSLAAPPTGSIVAGSMLYTSLKWKMVNCLGLILIIYIDM